MGGALVIGLPTAPRGSDPDAHWWVVSDGRVIERGTGRDWLSRIANGDGKPRPLIGLAPAAAVRLCYSEVPTGATPRQAEAAARMAAIEQSLGEPETLHAVTVLADGERRNALTAIAANSAMLEWLDWAEGIGVELDRILPAAALLPPSDNWLAAKIGGEAVIGRRGLVLPNEPALADAIVDTSEVAQLDPSAVEAALAVAAERAAPDLRTGRFAKRRRWVVDRARIRELVLLASLIPLLTLAWAVVSILRLDQATDRLDAETLRIAQAALGRPVTLESAEAELRQRTGIAGVGFSAPAAAILQQLQRETGVTTTEIGYREGTLAVTLAAPAVDAINRILVALQRDGHRITAVPRQSPDGRAMVDVTVRSMP